MLIDDSECRNILLRIAHRLTSDPSLREDLVQEGMIHLWLLEERRPRQTRSWYLQSCRFHLCNYIGCGRSVDSLKRRNGRVEFGENGNGVDDLPNDDGFSGGIVELVSARDTVALLCKRLDARERRILTYLTQGLGAREIARKLRVSHPSVVKRRQRIASLATKLGIVPAEPRVNRRVGFALVR